MYHYNVLLCFFPQYVPLPLFFAEDKLSFYKVMSDTNGYKHIHYVKDVSVASFLYAECFAQLYQSCV